MLSCNRSGTIVRPCLVEKEQPVNIDSTINERRLFNARSISSLLSRCLRHPRGKDCGAERERGLVIDEVADARFVDGLDGRLSLLADMLTMRCYHSIGRLRTDDKVASSSCGTLVLHIGSGLDGQSTLER